MTELEQNTSSVLSADLATGSIREADGRGKHTTVARTLVVLPGGGAVLDTPGLRGLALHDTGGGLAGAYPDVLDLALDCRFSDCAHDTEPDCAVIAAVNAGVLDAERVKRCARLARELAWQLARRDSRQQATARRELRRDDKAMRDQFHR